MNRFLLLLLLFSPAWALAQDVSGSVRRWPEVQSLTRAAPTTSCLAASGPEGMDLRGVRGFRVVLEAEAGHTLSGAGTLRAWYYDFSTSRWGRNPDLDLAVTASAVRPAVFADQTVLVRTGCVLYATDGVTVSGGSTVTVRVIAWTGGA